MQRCFGKDASEVVSSNWKLSMAKHVVLDTHKDKIKVKTLTYLALTCQLNSIHCQKKDTVHSQIYDVSSLSLELDSLVENSLFSLSSFFVFFYQLLYTTVN